MSGRIQSLECCCCGVETRGRQWYNRDNGYGLCPSCGDMINAKHKENPFRDPDDADALAGKRGTHWDIKE